MRVRPSKGKGELALRSHQLSFLIMERRRMIISLMMKRMRMVRRMMMMMMISMMITMIRIPTGLLLQATTFFTVEPDLMIIANYF